MKDPTPPSITNANLVVTKRSDYAWNPSTADVPGWEYTRLTGTKSGPYTLLCRCNPGVDYVPWISDRPLEFYVTKGELIVNGVPVEEGDYGYIPANTEGDFRSTKGMETLLVARGRVVKAHSVFTAVANGTISDAEAADLIKLPWIDHLRRHVSVEHLPAIQNALSRNDSARVVELCISIARGIETDSLAEPVSVALKSTSDLSLQVTAVLYLASKGRIGSEQWPDHLARLSKNPDALLEVLRSFYSARSNQELGGAIQARRDSGKYNYNEAFYKLVLKLING